MYLQLEFGTEQKWYWYFLKKKISPLNYTKRMQTTKKKQ